MRENRPAVNLSGARVPAARPVRCGWRRGGILGLVAMLAALVAPLRAVSIEVAGAGLWRNRELRVSLERLLEARNKAVLDANAIEDAAVILYSTFNDDGFQAPAIEIEPTLRDGSRPRFAFDPTFAQPLPRPLEATRVAFRVVPGIRSHVAEVQISGLSAIPGKRARAFFRIDNTLIGTRRTNAYSPSRVARGADALLAELRQSGYAEAAIEAANSADERGAVTVNLAVREGPRWRVASLRYQNGDPPGVALPAPSAWIGKPWSPGLEQDLREAIRQAYYQRGYPDIGVHVAAEPRAGEGDREADVVATIVSGPHVALSGVRFEGKEFTRESVLRRRVRLSPGDSLDPLLLDRARYRISRLGVFETVDLDYEPEDGPAREAVFRLHEAPRYETNLLLGYGSYEQFRGGVEFRHMNIFGYAHQSRLELVHSLKSTSGNYTYTIPELFGDSLDGTAKLFGLRRREIAFLRQEFGLSLTLRRQLRPTGGEVRAGYTFQALGNKRNALSTQATDDRQINVAAMTFGVTGERRDNPLRPRHGYNWAAQVEAADPWLGGEATFQRFEFAAGYHTGWGASRWVHLGFTHGMLLTLWENDLTLPVNKRFYPGGDNSVRGYQKGEAAPRGADGFFIGAKSYAVLNVELEQALTPDWSVVAFADALGTAVTLRDYPFRERLYSAGLGLRYQTVIGPVRLEYGRNLSRRPGDPSGTWHISIGYPF
jgi:outer membrane protein insertion porin family